MDNPLYIAMLILALLVIGGIIFPTLLWLMRRKREPALATKWPYLLPPIASMYTLFEAVHVGTWVRRSFAFSKNPYYFQEGQRVHLSLDPLELSFLEKMWGHFATNTRPYPPYERGWGLVRLFESYASTVVFIMVVISLGLSAWVIWRHFAARPSSQIDSSG